MAADRSDPAVGLGDRFAHRPEVMPLAFGLRNHTVGHQTRIERRLEQPFQCRRRVARRPKPQINQDRPFGPTQRQTDLGHCLRQKIETHTSDQFKSRHTFADPVTGHVQKIQRRGRIADRHHRRPGPNRPWHKLERRCRDNPQRSLCSDQQMAQVIAGVVLPQRREPVQDTAVGQDGLDTQTQITRVAIAQDVHAARVGRQDTTDPRTALRCDGQREQAARLLGDLLRLLQDDTRFDRHRIFHRIDVADLVETLQRQDDRRGKVGADLSADQPGPATVRDNGDPRLLCRLDNDRDFLGGCRGQQQAVRPGPSPARLLQVTWFKIAEDRGRQVVPQSVGKGAFRRGQRFSRGILHHGSVR